MRAVGATGLLLAFVVAGSFAACAPRDSGTAEAGERAAPADAFWASITELCGQAYEGSVAESEPPDPGFEGRRLVMHVRECGAEEIRIPFHVGDDRSRTWILTRTGDTADSAGTAGGLRLKHDHRHEDGTPDEITDYGGDTREPGTPRRQEFHADEHTASLVPEAATNVWTLEVDPDAETFTYALRREGTERRFRAVFDLTRPVDPPPPPWGHSPAGGR